MRVQYGIVSGKNHHTCVSAKKTAREASVLHDIKAAKQLRQSLFLILQLTCTVMKEQLL